MTSRRSVLTGWWRWRGIAVGFLLVLFAGSTLGAAGGHWPGWRGDGSGVTHHDDLPLHWNGVDGIAWRARIPGEGNGSPVVWGDRVFLTASVEGGRTRLVLCLDLETGALRWQTPVTGEQTKTYPRAGRAAATPVVDGKRVYAFFDAPGIVALTHEGEMVWQTPLGPFTNPYNMASSPILVDDMVIMKCDHQGPSFITALDRSDGRPRWRSARAGGLHYATPIAFEHEGVRQIVVNAEPIVAYEAVTGEVLWSCRGMKHATSPSPLYRDGLVYVTCGRNGPSLAIDPSGRGDVTDTHVRMHVSSGGPYVPSPVMVGPFFMVPGDDGRIALIDGQGRRALRHRVRGRFTASPVVAGNRIYWTDERSRTHVLALRQHIDRHDAVTHQLQTLAVNALQRESCYASPAVASGRYLLRTGKHLFCITGGDARLPPPPPDLPDDLDALRALYRAQPVDEHADTMLRLRIVERLTALTGPDVVVFLVEIIDRDGHWDVTEAALRELGRHGPEAVPALIAMLGRPQPFYRTVAAEHLAALAPPDAVDALIEVAQGGGTQGRVAAIEALGSIAAAHDDRAQIIASSALKWLQDEIGLVRRAAAMALKSGARGLGDLRATVVAALQAARADANPLVADAADMAWRTVVGK